MAAKQTQTAGELYPAEKLKEKTKTREALHRGICAANGWASGKMLTEEEYRKAVAEYKKKPMGRA